MAATAASDNTNAEEPTPVVGANGQVWHPPAPPPPPNKAAAEKEAYDPELEALSTMMNSFKWSGDAVESCARALLNPRETPDKRLQGVMQLKQLLCTTRENVFQIAQDVIDSGVLKALVYMVSKESGLYSCRLPAAFCLTNIAAGHDEQTAAVVKAGAVRPILELLRSREECLRRQAIFCLANIAGSTPEYRSALAKHKESFSSIIYAVDCSRDPKMEELAAWNIRNMCVLGGPTMEELREGLEYFAEQIVKFVPPEPDPRYLLGGGLASLTAVMSGHAVAVWARSNTFCPGKSLYGNQICVTPPSVRFATETYSLVSRRNEGRQEILEQMMVSPLVFHAKFNANQCVRNHALEALSNMSEFGGSEQRAAVAKSPNLSALGELLADWVSYTPQQRTLAARILLYLANDPYAPNANCMTDRIVMTRDIAAQFVVDQKTKIMQGLDTERRLLQNPGERLASLNYNTVFPGGELNAEQGRGILISVQQRLQTVGTWQTGMEGASILEIAYNIFAQLDRPEEVALREKCGRLIVNILLRASEPVICGHITIELFRLLLEIMDMAVEIDLQAMLSEHTQLVGATVATSLAPGEPNQADGAFTFSVLGVLERLLQLGEELQARDGGLENPMAIMLHQAEGLQRLESAMMRGALPEEVVQKTIHMVQKYCR